VRMFAVSEAKGWVELRGGKSPPRKVVTKSSQWVTREIRGGYDSHIEGDRLVFSVRQPRTVREKRTIVHTAWIGGRVLGTMGAEKFANWFSVSVRKGGCTELLPAQCEEVLALLKKERKEDARNKKAEAAEEADVTVTIETAG